LFNKSFAALRDIAFVRNVRI